MHSYCSWMQVAGYVVPKVVWLCVASQIVEVVGGIYAHSLAIITDAAHLLSDVSGFAVSVFAAIYAAKRSKEHFSYG
jgi:zinc transporter 2